MSTDERLDHLIAAAEPQNSCERGRVVALDRIVAETQLVAAANRLRIGRRLCLAAATFIVAVSGAVGVAEASHLLAPMSRADSSRAIANVYSHAGIDRSCELVFAAEATSSTAGGASRDPALTAAERFLQNADPTLMAEAQKSPASYEKTLGRAERDSKLTAPLVAVTATLQTLVHDDLARRGLDADSIHVVPSVRCEAETG